MKKLKTIELFCGTKSFSKIAKQFGHEIWTVDIDSSFNPDLVGNILEEQTQLLIHEQIEKSDIVWLSPDCAAWSLASNNIHWTKFRMPRTEKSIISIKMMMFCRYVADYCIKNNKLFFIENPNGRAVWIMDNQYLKKVWYCQYGDKRAKPTNIWTNLNITFKTCYNGNPNCHHEKAPRGSNTGTQGCSGKKTRGVIPEKLIEYIFEIIDKNDITGL